MYKVLYFFELNSLFNYLDEGSLQQTRKLVVSKYVLNEMIKFYFETNIFEYSRKSSFVYLYLCIIYQHI